MNERDEETTFYKGAILGVFLCLLLMLILGTVEMFTYHHSDVTKGQMFELKDKIYKCSEVKL